MEGGTSRSYGIQVARLAGIPEKVIQRSKGLLFKIENEGQRHQCNFTTASSAGETKKGHVQLGLFHKSEQMVLETLRHTDIATMTPMEAMNYLHELIEKSRNI